MQWFPPAQYRTKRVKVRRRNKRGRMRTRWVRRRVRRPLRFDRLVEHLCRQILHQGSTPELLRACCESVDVRPFTRITRDHPVVKWQFQRVLTTLLDSPTHLSR